MLLLWCPHGQVRRTSADEMGRNPTKRIMNPLSPPTSPKKGTSAEYCKGNRSTKSNASASTFVITDDVREHPNFVPLSVMVLRGNSLTDAGVLALCPLVEASATLKEIDLRDNLIGTTAQVALKKVVDAG